jgi:hypothetical protein
MTSSKLSKPNKISRRRFLRDIGVSAAAVPFIYGLESVYHKADAQTVPKKRLIVMYTPNGMLYGNWRLPQAGADLDITDGTLLASPSLILNPLQANAKHLLILDRISNIGARGQYQDGSAGAIAAAKASGDPNGYDGINHPGGHQKGLGNLLTGEILVGGNNSVGNAGLGNGISLDQVLAAKFAGKVKFPSLEIGVQTNEDLTDRYVDKRISYNAPATPRAPTTNPFVLFRNVFGTGMVGGAADTMRSDMDKSVLDNALADFTRLQPRMSKGDQVLLQQHSDSIRKIESQLTTVFKVDCANITAPTPPAGIDITNDAATHTWSMLLANYPTVGQMNMDIMVQAMACGLTNIATFFWANSENDMTFPWLSIAKGHHGMSHARDPDLVKVDQWYATQFNTMINKFLAIPESGGTGTMLDNSLLWQVNCLSDGSSHHSDNMPFTLAGSNGGYFKQGHAIRFNSIYTADPINDQKAPPAGTPDVSNSDLLVTILNSFEVATDPGKAPSTTFGRKDFCHGPLANIKA